MIMSLAVLVELLPTAAVHSCHAQSYIDGQLDRRVHPKEHQLDINWTLPCLPQLQAGDRFRALFCNHVAPAVHTDTLLVIVP